MIRFLTILFFCLPLAAQDLYVNFEDVAAGTTDSSINMGTISKTNGSAVTFAWTGSAGKVSVENGGVNMGLLTPVTVAGIPYSNPTPTKHLLCKSDNTVSTHQKFTFTFAASRKISAGFALTLSNYTGLGSFYNPGGFESGGTYSVLSLINDTPTLQAETNSNVGASVAVPNNTAIWVTALWDSANGKTIWDFYNLTNMTLIGRSTGATANNATINTFTWGITDAHTKDAGTAYRMNNLILYTNGTQWPVWPGGNLQVPTNSTDTAVTAAIAAAATGDQVALPITNLTWNSGVDVNKQVVVRGLGETTTNTILSVGNSATAFTLSGNFITVSNLYVKGTKPASSGAYGNIGFDIVGQNNRVCYNRIEQMQIGCYDRQWGCFDANLVIDCTKFRNIWSGGTMAEATVFSTFYPLAFNSTNYWHWEDNTFWITPDCNTNGHGGIGLFSSQQSDAWVFRHNTIILSNSAILFAPLFDFHGDDVGGGLPRPGMTLQIYKNRIVYLDEANDFNGKFCDIRGTYSAIYSNQIIQIANSSFDHELAYREERPSDSPNYLVTGSYEWENYRGSSGTTPITVTDDANITAGVDYFKTAMSPLLQPPYPQQLRNLSSSIGPAVPAFIGAGRGVRILQP
jgi:hypothetical protein